MHSPPLAPTLLGSVLAWGAFSASADARAVATPPDATEEIRVEGSRPEGGLPDPTAFGDVLRVDDFEAEGKSLADLLSESAGVFVRRFGGPGDSSEVSIRGSSAAQVAVTINGVRADSAFRGGFDLSRICLPLIDRVEIQRGGGAIREGSGAVGGTVNLVTRAPDGQDHRRVDFSGGSFDTYQGSVYLSERAAASSYALGYCGFGTEGDFRFSRPVYRGPDGVESGFTPPEARRINNDRVQHGASLGLERSTGLGSLRFDDFFVYSAGGEPGIDCCGGVEAGQNSEARSRDWTNLAQLRWRFDGGEARADAVEVGLHHRYEVHRFRDPRPRFEDPPVDVRQRISTLGARVSGPVPLPAFAQSLALRANLDFDWYALTSREAGDHSRGVGAFAMTGEWTGFGRRLLLAPGLRVDWSEGFGVRALPALGLRVQARENLAVLANVTPAFRIPSFDELFHPDEGFIRGNPDLEAEEAWEFDAGFEYVHAFLHGQVEVRGMLGYFYRDIDDSIVWVLVSDRTLEPRNTGAARVQGVELSTRLGVGDNLRVSFEHTELRSRRQATGEDLAGVPERESHLRVELGPTDLWKWVVETQYTGEIRVNEGGGRRLPSRTVWNTSVALNLAGIPGTGFAADFERFWLSLDFQNLGDVALRDTLAFPQPGRSVSLGFEVHW